MLRNLSCCVNAGAVDPMIGAPTHLPSYIERAKQRIRAMDDDPHPALLARIPGRYETYARAVSRAWPYSKSDDTAPAALAFLDAARCRLPLPKAREDNTGDLFGTAAAILSMQGPIDLNTSLPNSGNHDVAEVMDDLALVATHAKGEAFRAVAVLLHRSIEAKIQGIDGGMAGEPASQAAQPFPGQAAAAQEAAKAASLQSQFDRWQAGSDEVKFDA